ncbi:MAG: hypothetical protein MK212_17635 [Saprospiraceae bacterium]|nr:hypothetical protein [Saprospiraceae bacterium]
MEIRILLEYLLDRTINKPLEEEIYYNFIHELEKRKLFFGGGINQYGIEGCIDYSYSNLSKSEVILFLEYYIRQQPIFKNLIYELI